MKHFLSITLIVAIVCAYAVPRNLVVVEVATGTGVNIVWCSNGMS